MKIIDNINKKLKKRKIKKLNKLKAKIDELITEGMNKTEVKKLIGRPLYIDYHENSEIEDWHYGYIHKNEFILLNKPLIFCEGLLKSF